MEQELMKELMKTYGAGVDEDGAGVDAGVDEEGAGVDEKNNLQRWTEQEFMKMEQELMKMEQELMKKTTHNIGWSRS